AEHDKAAQLKEQLELATSDAKAAARLRGITHAALVEFAQTGMLADSDGITDPDVRAIYLAKLRECLAGELRRREEEQARRIQRIKVRRVSGEFQDFVAWTRRRLRGDGGHGEINYRLLGRLFRELNVTDPQEQQSILATLGTRPLDFGE